MLDGAGSHRRQKRLGDPHPLEHRPEGLDVGSYGRRPAAKYSGNGRPLARFGLAHLDAAETLPDVGREAGLAELAVVDAVDPGLDLLSDDLRDRAPDAPGQGVLRVGQPAGLGRDQRTKIVRPRQAAGMRRENPVRASHHGFRLRAVRTGFTYSKRGLKGSSRRVYSPGHPSAD